MHEELGGGTSSGGPCRLAVSKWRQIGRRRVRVIVKKRRRWPGNCGTSPGAVKTERIGNHRSFSKQNVSVEDPGKLFSLPGRSLLVRGLSEAHAFALQACKAR